MNTRRLWVGVFALIIMIETRRMRRKMKVRMMTQDTETGFLEQISREIFGLKKWHSPGQEQMAPA